jgi:hypothetical protein
MFITQKKQGAGGVLPVCRKKEMNGLVAQVYPEVIATGVAGVAAA